MKKTTRGTIHIFTYKGRSALSPLAHDLRLTCTRFEATLADDGQVKAWFDIGSIQVDGPMSGGRVDTGRFGRLEKGKILSGMSKDVLRSKRHPRVSFGGALADGTLKGSLELAGRREDIELPVTVADGRVRGRVTLTPSRWGIKPYKAMLGALTLQDRVEVDFDVEHPA